MSRRKPRLLTIGTILLVLATPIGIVSAALFGGFVPGFWHGVRVQSPTATYFGYFSINYVGVYHYVQAVPVCRTVFPPCLAPDEVVFFLNAKNGSIRLIFYCGNAVKDYCADPSQLPFSDGACVYVKGTLLEPSKWPRDEFKPSMRFTSELYVFHYDIISQ